MSAKNSKKRLSRAERARREKRRGLLRTLFFFVAVLCTAGALYGMAMLNQYDAPKRDLWVDNVGASVVSAPEGYDFMVANGAVVNDPAAQPENPATAVPTAEVAETQAGSADEIPDETPAPSADDGTATNADATIEPAPTTEGEDPSSQAEIEETDVQGDPEGEGDSNEGGAEADSANPEASEAPAENAIGPAPENVSIVITATGDCTLGGNVPSGGDKAFDRYVEKYGYDYFFQNFREIFEADDLTLVNLEVPLTTSTDMRENRPFNFRGKPEYVKILSGSSVEAANLANNHALDYGKSGLKETAQVCVDAGIGPCGWGVVYTTEIKGVRVSSLGFTEWDYTESQIREAIAAARPDCDLLIVSMHWGREKDYDKTEKQLTLAHLCVDAGADLVIGNHSHVVGGLEKYKGKYIIYSLGNFCFGGNANPFDVRCMVFQQTFNYDSFSGISDGGINLIPGYVTSSKETNNLQPSLSSGEAASTILKICVQHSDVDWNDVIWMEGSYPTGSGLVTAKAE